EKNTVEPRPAPRIGAILRLLAAERDEGDARVRPGRAPRSQPGPARAATAGGPVPGRGCEEGQSAEGAAVAITTAVYRHAEGLLRAVGQASACQPFLPMRRAPRWR